MLSAVANIPPVVAPKSDPTSIALIMNFSPRVADFLIKLYLYIEADHFHRRKLFSGSKKQKTMMGFENLKVHVEFQSCAVKFFGSAVSNNS